MFIDAHTHAQFAAFDKDWKEVIDRALAARVWMINVGTQKDTSRRAIEVARNFPQGVYASIGLHPIHTEKSYHDKEELGVSTGPGGGVEQEFKSRGEEFDYDYYRKLASDPKVLTIGECGLDYYRLSGETKHRQRKAFEQQIQLSSEVKKPLMIHCRNAIHDPAFHDLIDILTGNSKSLVSQRPGIIHFFTGAKEDARALLDLGFRFTFGGVITFARDYDEVIRMIPSDSILSETDAPYVTPIPYRGRRNEPANVIEVVKKLAEIRKVSLGQMEENIWANAGSFFSPQIALPAA